MNAVERELAVARTFAGCRGDDERLDEADAEIAQLRAENAELRRLLARYRDETPLGHQPHMIARQADDVIGRR